MTAQTTTYNTHRVIISKESTEFESKLAGSILAFVGKDRDGNEIYSDLGIEEVWTHYIHTYARGENF